jgi:YidC/Oxa1 family membrane protein insertase
MQLHQSKRREFIRLIGGAVAWPLAACAQHVGDASHRGRNPFSALDLTTIALLSLVSLLSTSISSAQPMTRDAALAGSPRIAIDSPSVRGSIALKGARIDDLALVKYCETVDPNSPPIVLLAPSGSPHPFYAEFGWLPPRGVSIKLPDRDTIWRQQGTGTLGVGRPVTLVYDNGEGLEFRRTISVDDKYLFTLKDEVANNGAAPITLYPYALISRHGTPRTHEGRIGLLYPHQGLIGLLYPHEGLIGMFGDKVLQLETYSEIEKKGKIFFSATNVWLGITDRYWATALVPNTDEHLHATFSTSKESDGTPKLYQVDYLLAAQVIPPGGSGSADTRLFAGAKEAATLDGYNASLHLNRFDLLIDWGGLHFIVKPVFLVIEFFFGLVHNYGIAILCFTVLVHFLLFLPANKSYASWAKSMTGGPLGMNEQEQNLVPRALYVLIIVSVQFSVFKVLLISIEMRHAPFFGWIDDISVPDQTNLFDLFGLIPFDPNTLPVLGPYLHLGIWPAIMCVTMWVLVRLNRPPADPTQKILFNWAPIIVGYAIADFMAGFVIYRVCHSSVSLLHQSFMLHRYGAKILLLDDLKRVFAKPKRNRPLLAELLRILQARSGRASINVSISIRFLRWIRRASRITFWVSAVLLSFIGGTTNDLLKVVLMGTVVLAVVIYLIALRFGQTLAGPEFAAALAGAPRCNRPIILFLRSFDIARSSLGTRFVMELSYALQFFNVGASSAIGDNVTWLNPHYDVEENLDNAIGLNAMFIAIGDRVASYGAAKIIVREEDWQETFYRLANVSQLIFIMPGPSAPVLWELSHIVRSRSLLEKTVFIMPRQRQEKTAAFMVPLEDKSLARAWAMVSDAVAELGASLPGYSSAGCYFRLREDGHPSEIVALERFTRALHKFVISPAYTGTIDIAQVLKLA